MKIMKRFDDAFGTIFGAFILIPFLPKAFPGKRSCFFVDVYEGAKLTHSTSCDIILTANLTIPEALTFGVALAQLIAHFGTAA